MAIDIEKAFKLPRERRYLNISVLWIFYYTRVVRLLYRTNIRHEAVTLMSLMFGIAAGVFLLRPGYYNLLLAALFVHLKDIFDASDGSLARMKGQTNRIARFLDSLCDLVAISWLLAALAVRIYPQTGPAVIAVAAAAWISIFLQCSYFNFYLVSYTKLYGATNVRADERMTGDDTEIYTVIWKRVLLLLLQRIYGAVYGWQDRIVAAVDRAGFRRAGGEGFTPSGTGMDAARIPPDAGTGSADIRLNTGIAAAPTPPDAGTGTADIRLNTGIDAAPTPPDAGTGAERREQWYGDKHFMTLNSPLCFGTHLFVLILCALLSRPELFYYIVIFAGNALLFLNIAARERTFGRRFRQRASGENV